MATGGTTCTALPTNCISVKADATCLKCEDDYYLSNGKCCKMGEYNNAGTCTAFATNLKC